MVTVALLASLGALAGAGLIVAAAGLGWFPLTAVSSRRAAAGGPGGGALGARGERRVRTALPDPSERRARRRRVAVAGLVGAAALAVTRWPVAFFLGALAVLGSEGIGAGATRSVTDRLEAVATWTEMLRDTLSGAAGLTQALVATAPIAPRPIRSEVNALAGRVSAGAGVVPALVAFGEALGDPAADSVIAALAMAATERAQRLGDLLGELARATRDEVSLRLSIEASRASARTAVRTITGFSFGLLVFMAVFARNYLAPYRSLTGQLVLGLVGCIFGAGLWLMAVMVRPQTFTRLPLAVAPGAGTGQGDARGVTA